MKKVIYFISCFFLFLNSTQAVTLECPDVASAGEVITCVVSESTYNGLKAGYLLDSGLEYQSFQFGSSWKSYYNGVDGFSVGNVRDTSSLRLEFAVKVGMDVASDQEYSISLTDIEASTVEYQALKLEDVQEKVRIVSDVNTLEDIRLNHGSLTPSFDKSITSYQVSVDVDKIAIEAVLSDASAKLEGDIGEQSLQYGVNHFVIKVTSSRGSVLEYHLYVTRKLQEVSKSSDITLKKLSISDGELEFEQDIFFYSVDVSYDVDHVDVEAIANHDHASVEILNVPSLVVGENIIQVIVTAEDGTTGTYIIVVNRKDKLSSDATIRDLKIKGYSISFQSDIYEYVLEIGQEEKLDLEVILNDSKAKYKVLGNKNLKNNSVIEIVVTAPDGSEEVYQIKVLKLNEANSSSIFTYVKVFPLILFLIFGIVIFIVKRMKKRVISEKE